MEIAPKLAKWIVNIQPEDIPREVLEKAKTHILDTIGVTIAGALDDVGALIAQYVETLGGKANCTVVGTSIKTACPMAALANGVLGHALDFDDTSHRYIGHTSVSVLPSALAVGEIVDASGVEVLCAYIIGTEASCKLGAMVSPKLYENGWHSTSVVGVFGAAAAAGKLLKLTDNQMMHALGISASMASGLRGNVGTDIKPFHAGRSAENGVVAAFLAHKGMKGFSDIFEKEFGFCHTLKVNHEFDPFFPKLGNPFDIDSPGFYLKEFPSCSSTHPALNATIRLIRENKIDPMDIESLSCAATPLVVSSLPFSSPRNTVEARFSMHFCLAMALLKNGDLKATDFIEKKLRDPDILKMMGKINLEISPELEKKGFAPPDGPEAAIVQINLKDGRKIRDQSFFPDWRPDRMPSEEALFQKFRDCASQVLPDQKVAESITKIENLENVKSILELTKLLSF